MKTQHLSGIVAFLASSAIVAGTLTPYTSTATERNEEKAKQAAKANADWDNVTKAFAELSYAAQSPEDLEKANRTLADLGYTDVSVIESSQSSACLTDGQSAINVIGTEQGLLVIGGAANTCETNTESNPAVWVRFGEGDVAVQNNLSQSVRLAAVAEQNILSYQPPQEQAPTPDTDGVEKATKAAGRLHKRLTAWKEQEGTYIATLKGLNENIKVPKNYTVAQYKSFAQNNKSRQAYLACVVGPEGGWVVYDSTTNTVTLSGTGENGTACVKEAN